MARVFLDTNFYIDVTKRAKDKWQSLQANLVFISPLSTHILFYARKLKVPDEEISQIQESFGIIPLTKFILDKALQEPTNDQKLLNMKFFGKTQILPDLTNISVLS